jgi:type II secretory pathway pseudopilin PulG
VAIFGRKKRERTIFLPWERRTVARALQLPRRRATAWLLVALALALFFAIYARNRDARNLRTTRATLSHARAAVDAFRADHGRCPRDLAELVTPGDHAPYLTAVPRDAWKRPLRFACPARLPERTYDLSSDGPDGEPYGLDAIE